MSSISTHSLRVSGGAGLLALTILAVGTFPAGAQETKPTPPPAAADAKDKDKAAEKEAPLPADAHAAQSIQFDGKPLHYTVTVGALRLPGSSLKVSDSRLS